MFVADGGLADSIVARATAAGPAARAIVRISGAAAFPLAARIFDGPLDRAPARARVAGAVAIDDVRMPAAAIGWRAPRSYTGEDLVELHLPGSPPLVERALAELVRAGARPAAPGEFTRRAFLSGKLDLAAAEAVLALTAAATEAEARAAARELRGGLGTEAERLRSELLDALAELEAGLDFADEDIAHELASRAALVAGLAAANDAVAVLLARESGRTAGDRPPRALLLGPPNAGKSSLLNALAGRDAALVSPLAGTTRDAVAARIEVAPGLDVEVLDAAGISSSGPPEQSGSGGVAESKEVRGAFDVSADAEARTLELVASTEIVVIVLDGSRPLDGAGRAALELSRARTRVIVLQKSDLPRALHFAPEREGEPGPGAAAIPGSARTGEGLAEIRAALASAVAARELAGDAGFGPNARQRACLGRARAALGAALAGVAADRPAEVVAIDLRAALDALGEVTGASCPEDLLDRIFARFCIGK